jgi:hypothetical protein
VPRLVDVIGWIYGRTRRNRYRCESLVAICISLRRMASPCRWSDLEIVFEKHASALSEIYWEIAETLVESRGKLINKFQREPLYYRAELYSKAIENRGAPLESCVGFIDWTKIAMARPGGRTSNQRAVYSSNKRFLCFSYQSITTPDGFLLIYTKLKIDEGMILLCTTRVELMRSYREHFWLMGNSFVKCVGVCEYVCVGVSIRWTFAL